MKKTKKIKSKEKVKILFLKKNSLRLLTFFLFAFLLFQFPSPNVYFKQVKQGDKIVILNKLDLPKPPDYPVSKTNLAAPEVSAQGVLIKDIPSGAIIYSKNENVRFPPASTTKIMTALIGLETYKLDDILVVKTVINNGRKMNLVEGERISFEALLYGTLVHSANDAAYTIAENYPGGVDRFVERMNQKAKELYLTDSHFSNPIGFDSADQYTTAIDLAKQTLVGLSNDTFRKIVSTKSITVSDENFTRFHELKNVNELLGKVAGVSGVKTGYTENAGEILVSEVKKDNRPILLVVLKSKDRFGETTKLIDWVYSNYIWLPLEEIIPTTHL